MFGAILKATNSSFQKRMTFCRSIYVKKLMKLLAFIFEQPSYNDRLYNLQHWRQPKTCPLDNEDKNKNTIKASYILSILC